MSRARNILLASAFLLAALGTRIVWEGYQRFAGHEVTMSVVGIDRFELERSRTSPLVFEDLFPPDTVCPISVGNRDRALIFGGHWLSIVPIQVPRASGSVHTDSRWQGLRAWASGMDAKSTGRLAVLGTASCRHLANGIAIQTQIGIDRLHATEAEASAIRAALRRVYGPPKAQAVLSIGLDGRARLMGVIVNGQRIDLKNWPRR